MPSRGNMENTENTFNTFDKKYLKLLHKVLNNGVITPDRTSVGESTQYFHGELSHTFEKVEGGYTLPFIQSRIFGPKLSFEEFKWMMSGSTDVTELQKKGIHIWDGNSTRKFLDTRMLSHIPEYNIGKSYGYQFRNLPKKDQIRGLIKGLQDNPTSRRNLINIWNPENLAEMALEPCAYSYNFVVIGNKLNLLQNMRSADILFGVPYNLAFGTYFLLAMSKIAGLEPGKLDLVMANAHIYKNQYNIVKEMYKKPFTELPEPAVGELTKNISSLEEFLSLEYSDFKLTKFTKGAKIGNADMAV